ncbi:MAG: biopolymer transporter ExbD [Planctomycetes bacterium]|nr:biopolymer transporter ExbD [Planctomycetota bacterium]
MPLPTVKDTRIEVDMVPYIDIITLLLLFLVFVGDLTQHAASVQMQLPRADQAKKDDEHKEGTLGRIVVQLDKTRTGSYQAVVETQHYELANGANASLNQYLKHLIDTRLADGHFTRGADGTVAFPVKLRIPKDAPMYEVEKVVATCAKAGLVNIHYAAEAPPPPQKTTKQ